MKFDKWNKQLKKKELYVNLGKPKVLVSDVGGVKVVSKSMWCL